MNKQDIYDFLEAKGIWHQVTEHQALFSMSDVCDVVLPYPESDSKNLFLRDKKKKNWYLVTVNGDKKVDLRKFREEQGTRALTFGSPEELMDKMGLIPGSVTPLGLLNNDDLSVDFFIDESFFDNWDPEKEDSIERNVGPDGRVPEGCRGIIGIHPNENTATVVLRTDDLVSIIKEHGNSVTVIKVPEK